MEYMGQTQTATYMTGPKLASSTTSQFLPAIGSMQSSYKAFDTYPAPSPLRRSHTTLPWRPSTYYGVAKVNPTVSYCKLTINLEDALWLSKIRFEAYIIEKMAQINC